MWKIVETIDNDHVGEVLSSIEAGQIITFEDGDVVSVQQVFLSADGNRMVATGSNYSMTLERE